MLDESYFSWLSTALLNKGLTPDQAAEVEDAARVFVIRIVNAAFKGDSEAQEKLGDIYNEGQGLQQDDKQAASWYRKAAEQGKLLHSFLVHLASVAQPAPECFLDCSADENFAPMIADSLIHIVIEGPEALLSMQDPHFGLPLPDPFGHELHALGDKGIVYITALQDRVKEYQMTLTEYKAHELTSFIVSKLQENAVIGIMRGRSEFGPRALCSRTILASPERKDTNDNINKRLGRTEFMPFAPIVPINLAAQCFENWSADNLNSRAMTQVFDCKPFFSTTSPAVTHIDNTARPQVITPESDPFMYGLLNQWHAATGCPSLVNTSFNPHEEPIVENLDDGLNSLRDKRVDMIVVEDKYVLLRA